MNQMAVQVPVLTFSGNEHSRSSPALDDNIELESFTGAPPFSSCGGSNYQILLLAFLQQRWMQIYGNINILSVNMIHWIWMSNKY